MRLLEEMPADCAGSPFGAECRLLSSSERSGTMAQKEIEKRNRACRPAVEVLAGRMSRSTAQDVISHLPRELGRLSLAALPSGDRFEPFEEVVESVAAIEGSGPVEAEEHLRGAVRLLERTLPGPVLSRACGELSHVFTRVLNPRFPDACAAPPTPLDHESAGPMSDAPTGRHPFHAMVPRRARDVWL